MKRTITRRAAISAALVLTASAPIASASIVRGIDQGSQHSSGSRSSHSQQASVQVSALQLIGDVMRHADTDQALDPDHQLAASRFLQALVPLTNGWPSGVNPVFDRSGAAAWCRLQAQTSLFADRLAAWLASHAVHATYDSPDAAQSALLKIFRGIPAGNLQSAWARAGRDVASGEVAIDETGGAGVHFAVAAMSFSNAGTSGWQISRGGGNPFFGGGDAGSYISGKQYQFTITGSFERHRGIERGQQFN